MGNEDPVFQDLIEFFGNIGEYGAVSTISLLMPVSWVMKGGMSCSGLMSDDQVSVVFSPSCNTTATSVMRCLPASPPVVSMSTMAHMVIKVKGVRSEGVVVRREWEGGGGEGEGGSGRTGR